MMKYKIDESNGGPGAVGGERSEPPSAMDSRLQTAQPSLGLRGERANEPVKPSNPERRRYGRRVARLFPRRRQFDLSHELGV